MKRSRPSDLDFFLLGVGSLMDLSGNATRRRLGQLMPRRPIPRPRTQAEQIADAWATVGRYMTQAMGAFAKEHGLPERLKDDDHHPI